MTRRGFTLIEVLLTLALVTMLTGGIFAFLWNLLERRDVLHRGVLQAQAAGAFVERLESDLLSGLAGDASAGAGVVGTATTLRLLTRGVWLPADAAEAAGAGDLQGTEYAFDWAKGELTGRRWVAGARVPAMEVITGGVAALRFRYFDGTEWRNSFDSASAGKLPVAVEVALWFGASGAGEAPSSAEAGESESPLPNREPDRLRVIVVPDGPEAAWREGA